MLASEAVKQISKMIEAEGDKELIVFVGEPIMGSALAGNTHKIDRIESVSDEFYNPSYAFQIVCVKKRKK